MALPENEKKQDKKEKPPSKVVVRRLPPSMDQETFLNQVSPIPEYNYVYTVKGDSSLGENAFSRAYINFLNFEDVYSFKERFDNYVFLDNKGHEYPAVVEFAPFQKIPKKRGKTRIDPKCSTIESDQIYLDFVESLNKPKEQDEKPEYSLQLTSENKKDVTTPLLEYIKNKRAQRMKIREVRREERKRREYDRRKERYDDRPMEGKSVPKAFSSKTPFKHVDKDMGEGSHETKDEKPEKSYEKSFYKTKERKYDERRKEIKPRYPKKEYIDNRDFKEKDYRSKYEDYRKEEPKSFPKKVKKYSEKREERKLEVQKAEQKKLEQANECKSVSPTTTSELSESSKESIKTEIQSKPDEQLVNSDTKHRTEKEPKDSKARESESQAQKRIRNKDRPTIAIYRPGMLSKRKQNDENGEKGTESKQEDQN